MAAKNDVNEHVANFSRQRDVFSAFALQIEHLLCALLKANGIPYQVVESRAKTIESFREKITRSGKSYIDPMKDLPDLCGCRVITYYADDVSKIGGMIEGEFEVLEKELSHQPAGLEPDRFGYLSAHYVVKLSASRRSLGEWQSFAGMHVEVQVRTVIQHAWSAVSHALQYKQETSIPSDLQRRLYRIAGLFELADEEFVGIRDQKANIQKRTKEILEGGPAAIALTSSSIVAAVENWNLLAEVRAVASTAGFVVNGEQEYSIEDEDHNLVPDIYLIATRAGINNTNDLLASVNLGHSKIFEKLFEVRQDKSGWQASDDFLFFLLLAERYKEHVSLAELVENDWSEEIAARLITALHLQE